MSAEWRQARVTVRVGRSDGNYGTDLAEVMLEEWLDASTDDETEREIVAELLHSARELAHGELLRSPSATVRQAVEPPRERVRAGVVTEDIDDPDSLPY